MKKLVLMMVGVTAWGVSFGAHASCYPAAQELPAAQVASFTSEPNSILQGSPNGGARMITSVRDLAATSEATLPLLLGLVANASPEQRNAIATGLAQAARICLRSQAPYSARIQQEVAGLNNAEFAQAFAVASGDLPTGTIGGGAGGGGGAGAGIGGPISFPAAIGGDSTAVSSSTFSTSTGNTNYFTGITGGSAPGSSTTTTTNFVAAAGSVSP